MKIIVLQGVPGSGKSTWAAEFAKEHKDYVIVCSDSIREATGIYWVPEREGYITDVELDSVIAALKNNLNVIIDATNLNPKTIAKWDAVSNKYNCDIEYRLFEIDYEEAVRRDSERGKNGGRSVGEKTIQYFFKNYFPDKLVKRDDRPMAEYDPEKEDVIVCDIDGTVALHNGRNAYDLSRIKEDTFDPRMKRLLACLNKSMKIIFVSGREGTDQCKQDTCDWIIENFSGNISESNRILWEIHFRKEGDYRNDAIVKEEIYKEHIKPYYNIITVFDDRNRVVDMWRKNGILCSQVYYGDF